MKKHVLPSRLKNIATQVRQLIRSLVSKSSFLADLRSSLCELSVSSQCTNRLGAGYAAHLLGKPHPRSLYVALGAASTTSAIVRNGINKTLHFMISILNRSQWVDSKY